MDIKIKTNDMESLINKLTTLQKSLNAMYEDLNGCPEEIIVETKYICEDCQRENDLDDYLIEILEKHIGDDEIDEVDELDIFKVIKEAYELGYKQGKQDTKIELVEMLNEEIEEDI